MPNLVLEYSNSAEERVSMPALLADLHHVMLQSGLFEASSVKSRTLRGHQWLIGEEGDSVDFIHVTVELLVGRSDEQKSELADALITTLSHSASHIRTLTVNLRDMEPCGFRKVINL
ncbi:5-carboxymethyl-2-hydroxymuconate Delta-isomerase [Vibrio sp. SM6]|uniref:5-carboxymethyl-2-hydroxymuconate Delta-isomerase n=1 Tax=Vibrio agarilyticus TaxID=2726741 RepID=A0A7X8TR85_9VIBR|nr:5-carboxymethyl-2-hydroxymuconate Delta-isomerase [Vibrio agarilyticus]NLS13512.1 5-carboxymethyl-2-hydroxymuconate Delta-isomerase [Vibrio agarilyticus]